MAIPDGNRVWLRSDGIIETQYVGDQTPESIRGVVDTTAEIVKKLGREQRPVYILVDVSGMGRITAPARAAGFSALRKVPFQRVAIYGATRILRYIITFIVQAARKTNSARVFESRTDATDWLFHGSI
jgi:hypothetical protein